MNSATFMFCKRCGAVTKPGICSYCGYDNDLWLKKQNQADSVMDSETVTEEIPADSAQPVDSAQQMEETAVNETVQMEESGNPDTAQPQEGDGNIQPLEGEGAAQENAGNAPLPEYQVEETVYSYFDPKLLEDDKKKKRSALPYILGIGIPVTVMIFFLFIIVGALVPLLSTFATAKKGTSSSTLNTPSAAVTPGTGNNGTSENKDALSESDLEEEGRDVGLFGERKTARKSLGSSFELDNYIKNADEYSDATDGKDDPFLQKGYINSFGTDHTNQDRDSFQPPYILAFAESIDTEVSYEFVRHYMNFSDTINGIDVTAKIAYYEIVSDDIPNLEELNQKIREQTCNEFYYYLKNGSIYGEYRDISFVTDSYITYNDEDKLSILLDIDIQADATDWNGYSYYNYTDSYIYGINVDLIDGEILDNSKILNVDEDFAKAFRKQCCDQNGYDIDGLNNMSNKTLEKFLSSKESSMVFLTPLGLEFGYLYRSSSSNGQVTGWMTITLQDYFDLLQDEYKDLFEGKKERPEKTSEELSEEAAEGGEGTEETSEGEVPSETENSEKNSEKSSDKNNNKEKDSSESDGTKTL